MSDRPRTASRLAGAVWGHLVGDAVGVPYEFTAPRPASGVVFGATGSHHQPPGTWSDDGALMLALLDSLLSVGFDPEDQARRALVWRRGRAYTPDGDPPFDIGVTTRVALESIAARVPAVDAGPADDDSQGNGSLMRILPLALVGRDWSDEVLIDRAHLASRVTHGHPACQVACAVYALIVRALVRGDSPGAAKRAAFGAVRARYGRGKDHKAHAEALGALERWSSRSGRGFVVDSFWSAWDAFAGASDYADAIRRAVAYGGDTDTTAAIAGGLAGAWFGWEGIPVAWRRGMRGSAAVTPMVDRLVATTGAKTSSDHPLRVDLLELDGTDVGLAPGSVGITFLPGKKRHGHTGDWWRDLDLDLASLREQGVDTLFLLVEDAELAACLVPELPEVMAGRLPELVRFPVHDPHVPPAGRHEEFRLALAELLERLRAGRRVAIACRGGIDRSGYTAACLLVQAGFHAQNAIDRVHRSRRGSLTMREGLEFVHAWERIVAGRGG